MNKLIDYVNNWAGKLTYRLLVVSGASQTALDNYVKGMGERDEKIMEADKELSGKLPIAKFLSYAVIFFAGIFIYDRIMNHR